MYKEAEYYHKLKIKLKNILNNIILSLANLEFNIIMYLSNYYIGGEYEYFNS
ncbi:hypothetical protein AC3_1595 [Clostridium perfringens E str. JGS1987]|uniref:Uncharacterized protein n=1 Tax=Clostridium perfringens E str. JGS1987 TaxID=451755 RepID=B1BRF8_CLOPF|nr:hypothetical protein AC3_1595 [Clostridium perfringens E str. JGS1987]